MKKIILKIGGMSCSACSSRLEKYLNKQDKIYNANVNLVLAQALIEYEDDLSINDLNMFVKDAGYESLGVYNQLDEEKKYKNEKIYFLMMGMILAITLYISMSHMIHLPVIPFLHMMKQPVNYSIYLLLLTTLFLIYGRDILKKGIKNIFHSSPNMDTLVTLGVTFSFIYSLYGTIMIMLGKYKYVEHLYFESVATIIYFIKLGRFIDHRSKEKTKEAIKELVQITPQNALLKTEGGEKNVTIDEVRVGDILIAKPGMKIAVDGTITLGESHLDEAFITGESIPIKKSKGDKVIAGSINYDGYLEYEAERIGKNSTISEIVRLVLEATNTKAPIARIADKISGYFVPSIIMFAILTFFGYILLGYSISNAIISMVTVLVVACPCALGLATPLAIVVSEGLCAKNGILVKSSEILENAHKIDTVIFDKTGTLTYGNLRISKIYHYNEYSEDELLSIVASVEEKSTHPIGKSFLDIAEEKKLKLYKVTNFRNIDGIGVTAKIDNKVIYIGNNKLFSKLKITYHFDEEEKLTSLGNSIVYVIEDKKVIALIGVKDIVREHAKETVQELKNLGKNVIMLTGDSEKVAKITSDIIGIKNVIANVLPNEKTDVIKKLKKNGKNIMMVGDGINDAPSLVMANIGVSIQNGNNIATDSADVILVRDDLKKILLLISISKLTVKNIKQNLFWAFFYNICMIPIAIGLLKPIGISMNPGIASIAMTTSSLTVILNALRLKKYK